MQDLIRRIAEWLRQVFAPGSGKRRAGTRAEFSSEGVVYPMPVQGPVRAPRRPSPRSLPRVGSPYGLEALLRGEEVALIRPYLVALEERRLQRERCRALLLALDGVDVGPEIIHGVRVAGVA